MFSRARRGTGHGGRRVKSYRRQPLSKAVVGVEPLEGRMLLSYLVHVKNHKVIPIYTGDARDKEPLFSNGLAFKHQAHFYPFYTGPKRPELNGVSATAVISGNRVTDGTLTLSGTVAGPIIQKPTNASQAAIYIFAIDRGGSAQAGPFPGRGLIRFDAQVVAPITQGGISAANPPYVLLNNASTNSPLTSTRVNLSPSSVKIQGKTITITVPLGTATTNPIPSTGKAIDQWNVNFFTRFPSPYGSGKNGYHSIASFTPEFTEFQVVVQHLPTIRTA
jgi:hypothetical protein